MTNKAYGSLIRAEESHKQYSDRVLIYFPQNQKLEKVYKWSFIALKYYKYLESCYKQWKTVKNNSCMHNSTIYS